MNSRLAFLTHTPLILLLLCQYVHSSEREIVEDISVEAPKNWLRVDPVVGRGAIFRSKETRYLGAAKKQNSFRVYISTGKGLSLSEIKVDMEKVLKNQVAKLNTMMEQKKADVGLGVNLSDVGKCAIREVTLNGINALRIELIELRDFGGLLLKSHNITHVLPVNKRVYVIMTDMEDSQLAELTPLADRFISSIRLVSKTLETLPVASQAQEKEIRNLIEQLVFDEKITPGQPTYSPGITKQTNSYRKRFDACQKAFNRLTQYKGLAIPFLVKHLDDKRQSINFRNHHLGNTVGHACYWNIYYQLQDRPADYSEYGFSRKGKDGKDHPKPYWEGTPFDSDGGLKKWLERNKGLSYVQKQIKCLRWLLEKEKAIGACDAEGYFLNILPLEIRILERKKEAGEDAQQELSRLRRIKNEKLVGEIPGNLLPAK